MSGQRNKKPDDIIMKRQEYLDNLNQEIALQDANEQAVKQYKLTGQLPPIAQIKDNRTVEDKLRDLEKLKSSIREDMSPIADTHLSNHIIQIIQNSPYNQDGNLLIFFAQRVPDIIKNLQKIYKFGIKGDANDAQQFANFVIKFYTDKNNIISNSKQFMARLGTNTQLGLSKKATQQADILNNLEAEINRLVLDIRNSIPVNANAAFFRQITNKTTTITRTLELIKLLYPPELKYGNAGNEVTLYELEQTFNDLTLQGINNPINRNIANDYEMVLEYINHNIPNTDYVNTLITTLSRRADILKSSPNAINKSAFLEALDNIYSIINTGENIQELINVEAALQRILLRIRQQRAPIVPAVAPVAAPGVIAPNPAAPGVIAPNPAAPGGAAPIPAAAAIPPGFNPAAPGVGIPAAPAAGFVQPAGAAPGAAVQNNIIPGAGNYNPLNPPPGKNAQLWGQLINRYNFCLGQIIFFVANAAQQNALIQKYHNIIINVVNNVTRLNIAVGILRDECFRDFGINPVIHGAGFHQPYGFTKQYVEPTEGVQTDPRYIKFGRYLVNTKSLKDNKLSLRREKGTPIASLPVYKMSNPFSKVIKKIVGGALPSQEDFTDLTEEELRYLHKVSKESDLSHKIEIPTPSKDEDEKDAHLFNVYKGEIMAGNDNKEMIRKFKLLLMKLSKNNTINKKEANEILEMLTHAGY